MGGYRRVFGYLYIRMPSAAAPPTHALATLGAGNIFEDLGVSAALWDFANWYVIHSEPNVIDFEIQHGIEVERSRHNARSFRRVRRDRDLVVGEHAGLVDFFLPVMKGNRVLAILAVGPVARERPTTAAILERWRWLTGRHGNPVDPEFSHYLSTTLSTLVLAGSRFKTFDRALRLLGRLLGGDGDAAVVRSQLGALQMELKEARYHESVWKAASSMVDERTSRTWLSPYRDLASLGLKRPPDSVLVGLLVNRDRNADPVEQVLHRDALQRACVDLARRTGNVVSGQVGTHGFALLSAVPGTPARRRQALLDLGDRIGSIARRSGFRLHLGTAAPRGSATLTELYQASLAAAESALLQGARLVETDASVRRPSTALQDHRRQLGDAAASGVAHLPVQFDRYLEAVGIHCGYRLDAAQANLQAGFERVTEALGGCGALDTKTLAEIVGALERATRDARTVSVLFAAYRVAIDEVARAVQRPSRELRDRRLRRAIEHIRQHYGEPLTLPAVARLAGFGPSYFSVLFKKRENTTFEGYVRQLRIEKAKQLLIGTDMGMQQVATLSGFGDRHYFARAFKRVVGVTPGEHRRQGGPTVARG
jgi:AraC-like DNA-binding protein